jgi:hypothetical protein
MEKIVIESWKCPRKEFEVVDEFPYGYEVWNIGRDEFKKAGYDGFVPLCQCDSNRHVYMDSIKAINVGSEELAEKINHEAGLHGMNKDKFLEFVKKYRFVEKVEQVHCMIAEVLNTNEDFREVYGMASGEQRELFRECLIRAIAEKVFTYDDLFEKFDFD